MEPGAVFVAEGTGHRGTIIIRRRSVNPIIVARPGTLATATRPELAVASPKPSDWMLAVVADLGDLQDAAKQAMAKIKADTNSVLPSMREIEIASAEYRSDVAVGKRHRN